MYFGEFYCACKEGWTIKPWVVQTKLSPLAAWPDLLQLCHFSLGSFQPWHCGLLCALGSLLGKLHALTRKSSACCGHHRGKHTLGFLRIESISPGTERLSLLFYTWYSTRYYLITWCLASAWVWKLSYRAFLEKNIPVVSFYFISSPIMIKWNDTRPGFVYLTNCTHLPNLLNDHLLFPTLDDQAFYWWSSYRTGSESQRNSMTNLKIE